MEAKTVLYPGLEMDYNGIAIRHSDCSCENKKNWRVHMYNETRRAAWAEIDLNSIVFNYTSLRTAAGSSEVIACIKADAYGHGAVKIAWELIKTGVEMLGVATLEEAVQLRAAGMRTPIVLLSATPRGNVKDLMDLNVIPVVSTYQDAKMFSDIIQKFSTKQIDYEIFVALETGMGRLGFVENSKSIGEIKAMADLPGIKIKGLFSHFATADEEDKSYSELQIAKFNGFVNKLSTAGLDNNYKTMANSAGIINYPEAHFNAIRPGVSLYGMYPGPEMDHSKMELEPAMSVKADIVYIKELPAGSGVSYGKKFVTDRDSIIGTLPLGYADGLPRILSGKGRVIVNGKYAPIVGSICMDQCMIDLTDVPGVKEYDEVVLMGKQGDKEITVDEIAEKTGTINYEVTCRFGQRLPKVYK